MKIIKFSFDKRPVYKRPSHLWFPNLHWTKCRSWRRNVTCLKRLWAKLNKSLSVLTDFIVPHQKELSGLLSRFPVNLSNGGPRFSVAFTCWLCFGLKRFRKPLSLFGWVFICPVTGNAISKIAPSQELSSRINCPDKNVVTYTPCTQFNSKWVSSLLFKTITFPVWILFCPFFVVSFIAKNGYKYLNEHSFIAMMTTSRAKCTVL